VSGNDAFVIWGASGHARVLADLLQLRGARVVALFDNDNARQSPWADIGIFHGPAGFQRWLGAAGKPLPSAALGIGGWRGRDRCQIADLLQGAGLPLPALIHPRAFVAASAELGAGTQVLAAAVVNSSARLERCVIVNTAASVDHECLLGEGVHVAPGATLCGCIEVGANTLIGPGATVVPRVRIGSNVIVGAGAVVTRDLPDNVVAWGSPARIIEENRR
jgi:sugar O-acyltransferase (sialic acid O-acetyltransferase NeuD family)